MPTVTVAMLTGSPGQWAVLATLLLVIFAPRAIPPLVRLVTRVVLRRYLGINTPEPRPDRRRPPVEVLPPDRPAPSLRQGGKPAVRQGAAPRRDLSPAATVLFVGVVVAVLSWLLLRVR